MIDIRSSRGKVDAPVAENRRPDPFALHAQGVGSGPDAFGAGRRLADPAPISGVSPGPRALGPGGQSALSAALLMGTRTAYSRSFGVRWILN